MNSVIDELIKKFGKGTIIEPAVILRRRPIIISLSPALDIGLSGGIPTGIIIVSSGKPKVGKSSSALSFAANYQKAVPDSLVFYFDIEYRLKPMNLNGTAGLDLTRFKIIGPIPAEDGKPAKMFTAEEYLSMARDIILGVPNALIIFDSASAMCTADELTKDPSGQIRAQGPKLMSHFLKQNKPLISANNVTFWSIHHLITNTSGKGEAFFEDGGLKIQFWLDVWIRSTGRSYWGPEDAPFGQKIFWTIKQSALGPPNRDVESYIRYGHGIDREQELIEFASALGIIKKAGSWYEIDGKKFQGAEALNQAIKGMGSEYIDKLEKQIKECLQGQ